MKKNRYIILLILILVTGAYQRIYCEQVQRDMFASVVVIPTFKISLDNANISFGYTEPGKSVELYPYKHYNELKCISNKGNTWYLKLSVIGSVIGPPDTTVKMDSFKWMVSRSTGDGVIEKEWHSFTEYPAVAYTSGLADSTGEEVTLYFKYKFDLPASAKGGNYNLNVLYTMTDIP
ncbi:MAG: hypothetical protein HZA30_04875 [Candidatus Omnitrophica bacterium]|nr:hypothetical protein [Candidatus Omnitrophota bacterium]